MRWQIRVFALLLSTFAVREAAAQAGSLEDRVKALEMKSSEPGKTGGGASGEAIRFWYDDGLRFGTADDSVAGRIGGHVIVDYLTHCRLNEAAGKIDGFSIDSAAIDLQCRLWKAWQLIVRAHVQPDGASLYYGWAEFNKWDQFKVRVGMFKEPFSTEETEDEKWVDMPVHPLTTLVVPGRNLGAMIHGMLLDGILNYAVGVFNGTTLVDSAGLNGDTNSDKDIAARLQIRPGATSGTEAIKHLMVGVDYTRGHQGDNEFLNALTTTPATDTNFHQGVFNAIDSNGVLTRLGLVLDWVWGPLSVKGEWIYFKTRMNINDDAQVLRGDVWSVSAGFWLMGSTRNTGFRPELKPKALFDGGFGDVQILGRLSTVRFGDTLEENAGWTGSRNVQEAAVGLNWYPNSHVRISAMYVYYRYDHHTSRAFFTSNGRRLDREDAIVLRAQIDF